MASFVDPTVDLQSTYTAMTLGQELFMCCSTDSSIEEFYAPSFGRHDSGNSETPTLASCTSPSSSSLALWLNDMVDEDICLERKVTASISGSHDTDPNSGKISNGPSHNFSSQENYHYSSCIRCTITEEEAKLCLTERRKVQNRMSQRRFRQRKEVKLAEATKEIASLEERVEMLQGYVADLGKHNLELQAKLTKVESAPDHSFHYFTSLNTTADTNTVDRLDTDRDLEKAIRNRLGDESLFLFNV